MIESSEDKKKGGYKYFWLIVTISILLVSGLWYYNYLYGYSLNYDQRGLFGDMFGAVNAVFSGLAFAGIIISLYLQRIDLKNQFEEIQQTNREFKIQNDTLQIQKFENQYYKMIDLHKENVNEMKITFFENVKIPYHKPGGNDFHIQEVMREVEGRNVFVGMINELHMTFSVIKDVAKEMELNYDNHKIFEYAYEIFFYGKNTRKFNFKDAPGAFIRKVLNDLQIEQDAFYKRHIEHKKIKSDDNFYLKFYPFEGQEARLAHYFRHLFQTVKYVVKQEDSKLITYEASLQYLRVLRAQLSNAEQLLIYYNYQAGFGKDWDYIGNKGYQFLTKYRMIRNISLNDVIGVENPREHFKDYIKNYATNKDPLFDWGDYD